MRIWIIFLVLAMLFVSAAEAREITMNLAFNINGPSDNIHVNETSYPASTPAARTFTSLERKYIAGEGNDKVLALVFAGTNFIDAYLNTTYSASDYLIRITQSDEDNRFLITYVNGTRDQVEDDLPSIDIFRTVAKTFGTFSTAAPATPPLFLRLQLPYDVQNFYKFGGNTKLLVKNLGKAGGLTRITVDKG